MANEKLIQVVDLCKSYHKLDVIKHISVDFSKNEVVSIIGPSGGGKSTFLRCMNLLEKPSSGQILFNGVDICAKGQQQIHRPAPAGMGNECGQQCDLFDDSDRDEKPHRSARPHQRHGVKKQAEDKAIELLGRVGLADRADAYTPTNSPAGKKQRVAIARALAM